MEFIKPIAEFFTHLWAMMYKNALVAIRSPKGTLGQILAPVFFMLLLVLFQNLPQNLSSPTIPVGSISACQPLEQNHCFTLLYTFVGYNGTCNITNYATAAPTSSNTGSPSMTGSTSGPLPVGCPVSFIRPPLMDQIMQMVANANGYVLNTNWNPNAKDGNTVIYKVPDYNTLNTFILNNPNVTQAAILFSPTYGPLTKPSFTLWVNSTGNIPFRVYDAIQKSIEDAIISIYANSTSGSSFSIQEGNFPVGAASYYDSVSSVGALFFYCAIMFNFTIFLYQIVNEKQLHLREGMRMIGLSDIAYWLSWVITNIIFLVLYTFILLIIGYAAGFAFFNRTDFGVLFLLFFVFGLAMMPLAILIGMFLTTTRQAINVGMLVFVIGTVGQLIFSIPFITQVLYDPNIAPPAIVILLQFYPPYNFSKMVSDISTVSNEGAAKSLAAGNTSLLYTWSSLYNTRTIQGQTFTIPATVDSIGYQIMDMGIFFFLAWFFYNILPSEKGNPIWFLFTRSYWGFGSNEYEVPEPTQPEAEQDEDVQAEANNVRTSNAELRIIGLHKFFNKYFFIPQVHAVQGLNLSVDKGTIFALLGHNGAGKTTTINILTGLLKPTQGDCVIQGKSLRNNLAEVQKLIGVCPQHNILWDELTPREHLRIFCDIKGVPWSEKDTLIQRRLEDVLLWEVKDKASGKFSGGMKRRLSVAIAAIGNPALIYLDEPTTGLDPMSRREIWNAIQRLKKDRIIILTTHSMEEADVLGDRIGVMAHGRLKCVGTSLHLKNKFGLGYRLNLSTDVQQQDQVKEMVKAAIPDAELIAATGGSLLFGILTQNLPHVVPFFKFIEENKDNPDFVIKEWGMSQTTLEEVFLKVTRSDANVTSFVV